MDKNTIKQKSWYKKKRYIIPLATFALILIFTGNSDSTQNSKLESSANHLNKEYSIPQLSPAQQSTNDLILKTSATSPAPANGLSNDNYYTNINNNQVHSPAYSNSVPAGASAICRDGTYSFSQNKRGTCSHHGGVAEWL